jgi:hypothetical protein
MVVGSTTTCAISDHPLLTNHSIFLLSQKTRNWIPFLHLKLHIPHRIHPPRMHDQNIIKVYAKNNYNLIQTILKAFSINACLSPRKTAAKVPNYNVCWEMLCLFVVEYVVITVVPIVLGQWVPPTKDHFSI